MATRLLLVVAALITTSQAIYFSECGNKRYGDLRLIDLQPNPINPRKNVTVIYNIHIEKKIPARLQNQLTVRKDFGWFGKINLCVLAPKLCKPKTITCADIKKLLPPYFPSYDCPFLAGIYNKSISLSIQNLDFSIFPSFLINGTYEADFKLVNADNPDEEVACGKLTNIKISS